MRSLSLAALFVLLLMHAAPAQDLLLKNAHIVDPATRQVTSGSIVIHNGTIAQITADAPAGFTGTVVDAGGKWVIPGLNDMHVHSFGNVGPGNQMQLMGTEQSAKVMLYCGVTGFLDLFSAEDQILALRNLQRTSGLWAPISIARAPSLHVPAGTAPSTASPRGLCGIRPRP